MATKGTSASLSFVKILNYAMKNKNEANFGEFEWKTWPTNSFES